MNHQVFIASHVADFQFLGPCLKSLEKFSEGFLPTVVAMPSEDLEQFREICRADGGPSVPGKEHAQIKRRSTRAGQDKMAAQIAMLRADEFCPEADYIWILGSDSFCTGPLRPGPFFKDGKPAMLYGRYDDLARCHSDSFCWKPGTEFLLGCSSEFETMRRLPLVYPRALFGMLRTHVRAVHGSFDEALYARDASHHDVSESNLLGTYAHRYVPEMFHWENIGCKTLYGAPLPEWPNPVCTFWSHGGLDKPSDLLFEHDGKPLIGKTPREIIASVL